MIEGLEYRDEDHSYWWKGNRVPSVTQALQILGGYEGIPKHILDTAAARGTAIHRATELHDAGTLDYATLDDEIYPYLTAWENFLHHKKPVIVATEARVFHPKYLYAGTLDREMVLDGELSVVDLKSCVTMMSSTGPQTAAYMEAQNDGRGKADKIKKRFGLQLKKDGTYELHPYKDAGDFNVFAACLTVHRFQMRNKP